MDDISNITVTEVSREISCGKGMSGIVDGALRSGQSRPRGDMKIAYPADLEQIPFTIVAVCMNGKYAGYITIADVIKPMVQRCGQL